MNGFRRVYYRLTAYVPRRLPHTNAEYERFLAVLKDAYGVPDEPTAWATVGGQIKSTEARRLRKPWGHIANAAKRLQINATAHNLQIMAQAQLDAKLKEAVEREVDQLKAQADKEVPPPDESVQGS